MTRKVVVAGVGMIPFRKPGASATYDVMGVEAGRLALADAGIDYASIDHAYVGWVYGDSTAGQRVLYQLGLTGIPIFNVNNNCATGSSALFLARQAVEHGVVECALALGFEQMSPGALGVVFPDRPLPLQDFLDIADNAFDGADQAPMALRLFGGAGYEYQQRHSAETSTFAKVRAKASRHAEHNERAIFRKALSVEDIMAEPRLFLNLTKSQCCPPTCGAAAAVVCSEDFASKHNLRADVMIAAQAMTTDTPSTFRETSLIKVVGYDMTKAAARQVYEASGIGPEDIDVVELHDCFTTNEVLTYEALGLCGEGEAEKFIHDGDNTYGGKVVTNPSGGLLSKGHPLGATGLAQCAELVWQLRGACGARQVANVRTALQHNLGLGGAAVVTLYRKI